MVKKKPKKSKANYYCIYCGLDRPDGHHEDCPIVRRLPKQLFGFRTDTSDIEHNLNLGRMAFLLMIQGGNHDKEESRRIRRLVRESASYNVRRMKIALMKAELKKHHKITGFFARKKIQKIQKDLDRTLEMGVMFGYKKKEFQKLVNKDKIQLAGKPSIPLWRNTKTDSLVYQSAEGILHEITASR